MVIGLCTGETESLRPCSDNRLSGLSVRPSSVLGQDGVVTVECSWCIFLGGVVVAASLRLLLGALLAQPRPSLACRATRMNPDGRRRLPLHCGQERRSLFRIKAIESFLRPHDWLVRRPDGKVRRQVHLTAGSLTRMRLSAIMCY